MRKIMFCPISSKTSKSRKSSHQSSRNSETLQNGNNHHIDASHATSIPYRYVTAEFQAVATDELSVLPGDVVLYEFTDSNSSGNWSHVLCLKTNKRGFVPSEILSIEPRRNPECKKKLPRSIADPIEHHSHLRSHHMSGRPPLNEDDIRPQHHHVREHQQRFGIPHSLQGSSGKQSFQKYPDLRHLSPPAYYNLRTSDPQYEAECRQFHRENFGLFMVTNNFVAREENDLNIRPGDYVTVLNKEDEDWYWVRRMCDQAEGFVPSRFICDWEQVKSILNKGNSTVTMKSSNHNDFHTYINHRPDRESLPTDQQSSVFQHI